MSKPDSRCGLPCTGCVWKESHGCGGCIETNGNPFYGECPIAQCCQDKGLTHCGECDIMPCEKLYEYSYKDEEHGDKPPGKRIERIRRWAAESGKQAWKNVLLTDSGWSDKKVLQKFLEMLEKPAKDAKILFIPTAANSEVSYPYAGKCFGELLSAGISPNNIRIHDIDGTLSAEEALSFDAIYFTGGDSDYLLRRMKETRFDETVKKMVHANKVYIGVSAGSDIATPKGLCLINAYLSFHCEAGTKPRDDMALPHIPLSEGQAIEVRWDGYTLL